MNQFCSQFPVFTGFWPVLSGFIGLDWYSIPGWIGRSGLIFKTMYETIDNNNNNNNHFCIGRLNRSQNEILKKAYQISIELKLKENKIITLKIINT